MINFAKASVVRIEPSWNERLKEDIDGTYNLKETPTFSFQPLDMAGKKALRDSCKELWERGVVSTKTMLETQGYSVDIEKAQRKKESSDGTDEAFMPRDQKIATPAENDGAGRPEKTNEERTSDPDAAQRGKQPKPSNPEGSMDE